MDKVTIIGLGLVGNSIGMALRRPVPGVQPVQVVGFDPDHSSEAAALRKFSSVESISPDLEGAVRGARMVIISTPPLAAREVLSAIGPFVNEQTVVTDTLPAKEQVMAWAGELLPKNVSFVGGHPFSRTVDLETAGSLETPGPDIFHNAPYCIIPLPSAGNEALHAVIGLAETLGARPLFIDPREHDSFMAAVGHLPSLASAALLSITMSSPSWRDMGILAQGPFKTVAEPMAADPQALVDSLISNRQSLVHWVDQYLIALQDLREMLSDGNAGALLTTLQEAHNAREQWKAESERASDATDPMYGRRTEVDDQLRNELQQTLDDSKLERRIFGRYLSDRFFGKREK